MILHYIRELTAPIGPKQKQTTKKSLTKKSKLRTLSHLMISLENYRTSNYQLCVLHYEFDSHRDFKIILDAPT